MPILWFILGHLYLSAFCQSFFLHRYTSHRMYRMPVLWERFFYVLTYLTQAPLDMNPRSYAIMHRMHHAYADTPKDPHSPAVYHTPLAMIKNAVRVFRGLHTHTLSPEPRFEGDVPQWPAFDRLFDNRVARWTVSSGYIVFYLAFASAWWMYLFLPFHFIMGLGQGAFVNWIGHQYGYKNFATKNDAKNSVPVDLLGMGELIHNNHHARPWRANFAVRWFEFDPVFAIAKLLSLAGILRFRHAAETR